MSHVKFWLIFSCAKIPHCRCVIQTNIASVVIPPNKCAVTIAGLSNNVTVSMPNTACMPTTNTSALGSHGETFSAETFKDDALDSEAL